MVFDVASRQVVGRVKQESPFCPNIAATPDGKQVWMTLKDIGHVMVSIDTATNTVVGSVPIGQAPQAIAYLSNAVPEGAGTQGLQPLGIAGQVAQIELFAVAGERPATSPTAVSLFDQGLLQVLQASASGLQPRTPYVLVLALAPNADGSGQLQPLQQFMTNPAGAAIVDTLGPIRQVLQGSDAGHAASSSLRRWSTASLARWSRRGRTELGLQARHERFTELANTPFAEQVAASSGVDPTTHKRTSAATALRRGGRRSSHRAATGKVGVRIIGAEEIIPKKLHHGTAPCFAVW